jgi:ATP-dependent Lhr-like helicase
MTRSDALDAFSAPTREWFRAAFQQPTPAQEQAWQAISAGQDTLVVAPTGSGKTLAAFLWSIDQLLGAPVPAPAQRCRVLYVSPLKALAVDVERNLRAPLAGVRATAERLGTSVPELTTALRSGDTPAAERRRFTTKPPDIFITTPESLFLILTSQARESLRSIETVIVDEVHAVAATKRGAHLAVSLERLDALLDRPAQRIGLSATVRPVEEVAQFLGGSRKVSIVRPPTTKTFQLEIHVPVEDMAALGDSPTGIAPGVPLLTADSFPSEDEAAGSLPRIDEPAMVRPGTSAAGAPARASIWPALEGRVLELIAAHRSTIVFVNSRRTAERLCSRLNELVAELQDDLPESETGPAITPNRGPSGLGAGLPLHGEVARAHHGSVSRDQRALIEEDLKAGRLPAVVATSSLELGIDMGAVDLVIQVESPPSVASGLQRVGRAGHQVGAVSRGVILPKYRGDLVQSAIVAERMPTGSIEALHYPRNPLDVLAQQIVAMLSMDDWTVDELGDLIRRAAPFAGLPASALDATLDMLSGRYPSDDFAELRPRITWDRLTGKLAARPGAQRLAVTSGGTIPDRGLFGVFLVGEKASRVGELDEEMVYESRVGDVILLGSSSWRIEDITPDRVLVTPAPGQPGRLPFWHGDSLGRPLELGRALGAFLREVGHSDPEEARKRLHASGLDAWAADNLLAYLTEQKEATGHLPDDRTILIEHFRDELGDWRICLHSPFGAQVHAPWALALAARLRERTGIDVQAMHSDDGIVLRLPEADTVPDTGGMVFEPEEVDALVQAEVGASALFASRFRECAARALLLPRRDPTRRTPLWQQRQRSSQLLSVASEFGSFPIVLETMRECLQDVYDVPGLTQLMTDIQARKVRVVDVETQSPSPFARSLLFGYIGAFMYEGDAPLAERRAQALSLDSSLLAELLGQAELRELLDSQALEEIEAELQRLVPERHARDAEGVADLLRLLGDLTTTEALERGGQPAWLAQLEETGRVLRVRIAGTERWVAVEDAGRLRDALGVPPPVGVPAAYLEPVRDPMGDLIARYARTHGPFQVEEPATRFGLGPAVVTGALQRLASAGRVASGEFRPGGVGLEWCSTEVLRTLRRRSLARLRKEVEPAPVDVLARFLPAWQGVRSSSQRGVDGLLRTIEQLQGVAVPASALESLVLPVRVSDYSPALLDELCAAGEVLWAGSGGLPGGDGWVSLLLPETAPLVLAPAGELEHGALHRAVLSSLAGGAALFFRRLADLTAAALAADETTAVSTAGAAAIPDSAIVSGPDSGIRDGKSRTGLAADAAIAAAVWDLVWAGLVTNDTLAPVRAAVGSRRRSAPGRMRTQSPLRRGRRQALQAATQARSGPAGMGGRWSLLPDRDLDPTLRAHTLAELLLDRHGIVTRGAVAAERIPGGFAGVYPVLRAFEDSGRTRRGYFVETLGAAQFAAPGAVDRMRALTAAADRTETPLWTAPGPSGMGPGRRAGVGQDGALVLAATDPANPFGAALPWPERGTDPAAGTAGHRPGRKAGALVVIVNGVLTLYVERGGKSLLSWVGDSDGDAERLQAAADALALAVRDGSLGRLAVERSDGETVLAAGSAVAGALEAAGFRATPRGLRLRA